MKTLFGIILVLFLLNVDAVTFPGPDEDPLVAVLEFRNKMKIFNPSTEEIVETIPLKGGRRGASACMDFNYRGNMIYFTDLFANTIYSLKADGGSQNQTVILEGNLGSPEGIAYDWIHNNLYVCDWRLHKIEVVNPDTGHRKSLINTVKPRDIEVDPRVGWMYYIAGWDETAKLVRCGLDGQYEESLTDTIHRPMALTLDYDENKLYWTEMMPINKIYRIDTDGRNEVIFYQTGSSWRDPSPRYLTIAGDTVYFTLGYKSRVYGRPKHNGTENKRYSNLETYGNYNIQKNVFMGMLAIDPRKQPDSVNLCGDDNGGCSHFCLLSPADFRLSPPFTCHCPDGMVMLNGTKTCADTN